MLSLRSCSPRTILRSTDGIYVAPLDPKDLTRFAAAPKHLFGFQPSHLWERWGEANEYLTSKSLGTRRRMRIYTPPGYLSGWQFQQDRRGSCNWTPWRGQARPGDEHGSLADAF